MHFRSKKIQGLLGILYSQIVVFFWLKLLKSERAGKKQVAGWDGFDAEDASSAPTVVTVAGQLE